MTRPRPRALSGIKPTGSPHLGNYFGMIQPAIALQDSHDAFYFVADYHALTTGRDAKVLRDASREITATFLALGLDPARATFFRQSDVPEVLELTWQLACVTGTGLLMRAHAYKAAEDKGEAGVLPAGTFFYPALMAADILAYDSDVVPVGRDQLQHVEMAQDMGGHFNAAYGNVLKRPEPAVRAEVPTIVGTDGRKMSKSYGNTIDIFATEKNLRKAVMSYKTDSKGLNDPKDPDGCNVFSIYRLVATPAEIEAMADRYRNPPPEGFGYGHAKAALAEKLLEHLSPARERYASWMSRPDDLEDVLRQGAAKARPVARAVVERARAKVGLPKHPST